MIRIALLAALIAAATAAVLPMDPAPYCNRTACVLPSCKCASTDTPNRMDPSVIPQVILLTFDDAVTVSNYQFYEELLFANKNPNGCPVKATFFLSHQYTNYSMVNELRNRGYEIASHSITHRTDQTFWLDANKTTWERELLDMRTMAEYYANIPEKEIIGSRVPFLLMGGNEMFSALKESGFEWDCTWSTRNYVDPGIWPYTLDYRSNQDCPIGRCPTDSFPSTWVAPMIDLFDVNGNPCAMLDTCTAGKTKEEVFNFLNDNFKVHYEGTRTPFGLYLHSAWFGDEVTKSDPRYLGYKMFLEHVKNTTKDTYILSVSQMLEWMKKPTPLSEIKNFAPWGCATPITPARCKPVRCQYDASKTPFGTEQIMTICNQICPPYYPWYENIYGENPPPPPPPTSYADF